MELALYAPDYGYYSGQSTQLGKTGDFVTATHVSPDFAELLAVQFVEIWQYLGCPTPFHLVEMGPGQGQFAEAVLNFLWQQHPDCLSALRYILVEASPALRTAQQDRLQSWLAQGVSVVWTTLVDILPHSVIGCFFSNELVDALPVHLVHLTANGLQEVYVTATDQPDQPFAWAIAPLSTPALSAYFEAMGINLAHPPYPLGYTTEVSLAAVSLITQVGACLQRGYVITIDYGYPAGTYYSVGRSQGTLQCYYRHAHHHDPLIHLGQQDITAHVNFTALEYWGKQQGLETLDCVPQALFLMALGLGDLLTTIAQDTSTDPLSLTQALQKRDALQQLIHPMGLGQFQVLVQARGLTHPSQYPLRGLTVPPLMSAE
jgi:SAM-dependent MidA family methyltransferase